LLARFDGYHCFNSSQFLQSSTLKNSDAIQRLRSLEDFLSSLSSQIAFSGQRVRGSNQMSKIRQYNPTSNEGPHTDMEVSELGPPARGMPDALAYSEANNSLPGYCSVNSRNNFWARGSCFSRRAARESTILANCSIPSFLSP